MQQESAWLERQFAPPVEYQHDAAEHAAEVGEVGDARSRTSHAEHQFEHAVAGHEQPRWHRDRWYQQHDALVREEHTEGEQHAEHGARGADRGIKAAGRKAYDEQVRERGRDQAHEVISLPVCALRQDLIEPVWIIVRMSRPV